MARPSSAAPAEARGSGWPRRARDCVGGREVRWTLTCQKERVCLLSSRGGAWSEALHELEF